MAKKILPKHNLTIIADDFREEARNKVSLMGIYGQDIFIHSPTPAIMPKLCFFTRLTGGEGDFSVIYSIKNPDGEELLNRRDEVRIKAEKNLDINLNLSVSPFSIKKEGEYKFTIFIDGEEFTCTKFYIKYVKLN